MDQSLLLGLMTAAALYVGKLWGDDVRAAGQRDDGAAPPSGFPGATVAPARAVWLAVGGALAIVAAETLGEIALGLAAQQSRMTWLFALYTIVGAPIIEELVFRGWLVVDVAGRSAIAPLPTWAGAIGASVLFATLHPFLWRWDEAGFAFTFGAKGWCSTGAVFATSLWLYAARLAPWNPRRSLLPCFVGHAAKNLGVVVVKATAGFLGGLW